MNLISLTRVLNNGFLNYRRNFWLSIAVTVVMVITLFTISTLLILNSLTTASLQSIKNKVDISVFFNNDTSETIISQIQHQIEFLPEVQSVRYIPPVEARDKFIELHRDDPLLVEAVNQFNDDSNPFPASFAIRVHDLKDYPVIISIFEEEKFEPFVKKITDKRDIVSRLNNITTGLQNFGLILTVVFLIVTVLVMFNTIRLTIYSRRHEIEIMRLVGASNWYIRGPFVVEGVFYGLAGTLITSAILFPILIFLMPKVGSFLEINANAVSYGGVNIWLLALIQIGVGVGLGILSAMIVVRRYLKI